MAQEQSFEAELPNHPEKPELGTRKVRFGPDLWIEQDDFREEPPKKWFRLAPGAEVRLRGAAIIRCNEAIKDAAGNVSELRCTRDESANRGNPADGRKIKGTIHWVNAKEAIDAEARLYEQLFLAEDPMGIEEGKDWREGINPNSLEAVRAKLEPSLANSQHGERFQFERMGYFAVDSDSSPQSLVFNRAVGLKDTWAKIEAKGRA